LTSRPGPAPKGIDAVHPLDGVVCLGIIPFLLAQPNEKLHFFVSGQHAPQFRGFAML
jgi:hypothetical protein